MTLIYLVEIEVGLPGSPTQRILRAASGPSGFNSASAPGFYKPRLVEAANIRRAIVAPRHTFGESEIAFGEIRLNNIDGFYDEFFDFGYGFTARVLLGEDTDVYSNFEIILTGKVEQPTGTQDDIIFRYKDRQLELDRQVSPSFYLGDNSGTTGTEGTQDDLKGQNKIRIFGTPFNVQADLLNTSDNIVGLNHDNDGNLAPVKSIIFRLNGSDWDLGTNFANLADLQAGSPGQGIFDTVLDLGLARFGGLKTNENGTITIDVEERDEGSPTNGLNNQIGDVIERLLIDAGIDPSDIDVQLDTTSPSQAPWQVGVVVKGETYRETLDFLTGGSAIWYAPNRLGVYQVRKFEAPGVAATGFKKFDFPNTAASNEFEIRDLQRITTSDPGRGVPAWRITVNYKRMWTVQDKDGLALALTEAQKELFSREWRSVTVTNEALKDQFPEAVELEFNTAIVREDDALDLAQHLQTLYGVQRSMFRLIARYNVPIAQSVDLGDTITVTHNRYGLDNGKDFVITGIRYNAQKFELELELWG